MSYSRRRPRLPPNDRVTVRLMLAQRDVLLSSAALPQTLGQALHHARVDRGELSVRLGRESLDALIAAAAAIKPAGLAADRTLDTLLHYLESLADRFADSVEPLGGDESGGVRG